MFISFAAVTTLLLGVDTWEWSTEFGWDHVSDGGPDAILRTQHGL